MRRLLSVILMMLMLLTVLPAIPAYAAETPMVLTLSAARWDTMGPLSENMFCVSYQGLYGFMDRNGRVAITPKYSFAMGFQNGYAYVVEQGRGYLISYTGEKLFTLPEGTVVPPQYDITPFRENNLLVDTTPDEPGGTCFYNLRGEMTLKPQPSGDYLYGLFNNTVVCLDKEAKTVAYFMNTGYRIFGTTGVINAYPIARNSYVVSQLPAVSTIQTTFPAGDLNITLSGSNTSQPLEGGVFSVTSNLVGGYSATHTTGSSGVITIPRTQLTDGEIMTITQTQAPKGYVLPGQSTLTITVNTADIMVARFVNAPSGDMQEVSQAYSTLAPVQREDGTWDLLNTAGQPYLKGLDDIVPNREDSFSIFADGIMTVKYNGKYAAMNSAGQVLVQPKYDSMSPVFDTLAAASQDGKYGMVNRVGAVAIPFVYEWVDAYRGGFAPVLENGRYKLYNKNTSSADVDLGQYEQVYSAGVRDNLKTGLFVVRKGGKYGLIEARHTAPFVVQSASGWAAHDVNGAILKNLVPESVQYDWGKNVTRQEFAQMAIRLIEARSGSTIELFLTSKGIIVPKKPFPDTDDVSVRCAYALGIVNGMENGTFNPGGAITRQEAAKMLALTAEALGTNIETPYRLDSLSADAGNILPYAKPYVAYVVYASVMEGVGGNRFNPRGAYTREQAAVTMLRLLSAAG